MFFYMIFNNAGFKKNVVWHVMRQTMPQYFSSSSYTGVTLSHVGGSLCTCIWYLFFFIFIQWLQLLYFLQPFAHLSLSPSLSPFHLSLRCGGGLMLHLDMTVQPSTVMFHYKASVFHLSTCLSPWTALCVHAYVCVCDVTRLTRTGCTGDAACSWRVKLTTSLIRGSEGSLNQVELMWQSQVPRWSYAFSMWLSNVFVRLDIGW